MKTTPINFVSPINFVCPECGSEILEEVSIGIVQYTDVTGIRAGGELEYDGNTYSEGGDFDGYQCHACHFEIPVDGPEQLLEWIANQNDEDEKPKNLVEWFDVNNFDHIKAYNHLLIHGCWPEDFLPEDIEIPNVWQVGLANKLANAYVEESYRAHEI